MGSLQGMGGELGGEGCEKGVVHQHCVNPRQLRFEYNKVDAKGAMFTSPDKHIMPKDQRWFRGLHGFPGRSFLGGICRA